MEITSGLPPSSPKFDSEREQPSAANARNQLERILANPAFVANVQRKALLRYLVDEVLAGRPQKLKGFTIAAAVFNRDETFDAQSDPVVRLEARRLRRDLDIYYGTAGADDPVRITVPKGAYVPFFEWQVSKRSVAPSGPGTPAESEAATSDTTTEAPLATTAKAADHARGETSKRGFRRLLVPTLVGMAIVIAAVGGWLWDQRLNNSSEMATVEAQERGATVIVLPFEALSADADDRFLAAGLSQQLIASLMQFSGLKLYSVPSSLRQSPTADPANIGQDLPVAYVVNGSVRSGGGRARVSAQLADAKSGQVLWSETYDRSLTPDNLLDVQEDLATQIADRLGQPYGIVRSAIAERFSKNRPQTMAAYGCVLRAYTYRSTFSRELYPSTRACLEEAVRIDPAYADAFALLGWLHLDAARYRFVAESDAAGEMEQARIFAERAVTLAPKNPLSLQALAAVSYYREDFDKAEKLQRAVLALNPNDPEASAQLGWRLAFRGRWDEGLGYLRRAIERSLSPPAWYRTSLAMHAYLQGNYAEALVEAEQTRVTFSGIGLALYAMTQAALGNQDEAKKALDEMAVRVPHFARDPAAALRIHHIDEPIIDRLVDGLRKAGWKEPNAPATTRGEG